MSIVLLHRRDSTDLFCSWEASIIAADDEKYARSSGVPTSWPDVFTEHFEIPSSSTADGLPGGPGGHADEDTTTFREKASAGPSGHAVADDLRIERDDEYAGDGGGRSAENGDEDEDEERNEGPIDLSSGLNDIGPCGRF